MGVWDRLHVHLLALLRKAGQPETDMVVVDGVLLRTLEAGPVPKRAPRIAAT